jgi:hypothetical protein
VKIDVTVARGRWERAEQGAEAWWIRYATFIDGVWYGLKVYRLKCEAVEARGRNSRAARVGCGPPVGDVVGVWIEGGMTGRAQKPKRMHGYLMGQADTDREPHPGEIKALEYRMVRAGLEKFTADLDARNVGVFNGALVCIDFGACSVKQEWSS